MPVLPFLEDDPANIRAIYSASGAGAHHVIPAWGVTLRDRQRDYFYAQLDQRFPGVRARYERAFGERYSARSRVPPNSKRCSANWPPASTWCWTGGAVSRKRKQSNWPCFRCKTTSTPG